MPPHAIIVAGANGSGKTTFARQVLPLLHTGVPFLNADEIQRGDPKFAQPIAAAKEFLRRLGRCEAQCSSFVVETTLASRTYLHRLHRWKNTGFSTTLHFIEVPSEDFAVARVRARVAAGGHDIPEPDIRRRFRRGRELFFGVYKTHVDRWFHWVSDDEGLRLVATGMR